MTQKLSGLGASVLVMTVQLWVTGCSSGQVSSQSEVPLMPPGEPYVRSIEASTKVPGTYFLDCKTGTVSSGTQILAPFVMRSESNNVDSYRQIRGNFTVLDAREDKIRSRSSFVANRDLQDGSGFLSFTLGKDADGNEFWISVPYDFSSSVGDEVVAIYRVEDSRGFILGNYNLNCMVSKK